MEPTAVTIHESSEIAPTCAIFVGSMMIPEPIMFTATMNVSCIRFIFFWASAMMPPLPIFLSLGSLADHIGVEPDAAALALLEHPLNLVVEAREAVERFLKRHEVLHHRLRAFVPALTRQYDADAGRIDQRE